MSRVNVFESEVINEELDHGSFVDQMILHHSLDDVDTYTHIEDSVQRGQVRELIHKIIPNTMSSYERYIIDNRLLTDTPETLDSIGPKFNKSRETVRKAELRILSRLRNIILCTPEFAELAEV